MPYWLGLSDFDGDADVDVAVTSYGAATMPTSRGHYIGVLYNNGGGALSPQRAFATGRASAGATIADLDADGRPDIVTSDPLGDTISILLQRCVR